MNGKMIIDVPTSPRGVAVTKYRVAQWLRHLEKTSVQQAPTIVKTMMNHFLDRLEDQTREGRVYIHKEQRICGGRGDQKGKTKPARRKPEGPNQTAQEQTGAIHNTGAAVGRSPGGRQLLHLCLFISTQMPHTPVFLSLSLFGTADPLCLSLSLHVPGTNEAVCIGKRIHFETSVPNPYLKQFLPYSPRWAEA